MKRTVPLEDPLDQWRKCEKCHSPSIYPGGVGDWRHTIICERCFHVRRGVPLQQVIIPLIMEQYSLSREDAEAREAASQRAYERALANVSY